MATKGGGDGFGLGELFASARGEFEDGDMLFVAHRQKLRGTGFDKSISWNFFTRLWVPGRWRLNLVLYSLSMVLERVALALNNTLAVTTTGRNAFFPNKPKVTPLFISSSPRVCITRVTINW